MGQVERHICEMLSTCYMRNLSLSTIPTSPSQSTYAYQTHHSFSAIPSYSAQTRFFSSPGSEHAGARSDEGFLEVLDWHSESTLETVGKVDEEALRQDIALHANTVKRIQ